jgi:hypothetical protein
MKDYTFFVHETTISEVTIKAGTEEAARVQWYKFVNGAHDAPELEVCLLDDTQGYELSDLREVTE